MSDRIPKITTIDQAKAFMATCADMRAKGVPVSDSQRDLDLKCFLLARQAEGRGGDFYRSPEWRALRYSVLRERGRKCECCGSTPADGRQVHVDHIIPRSKNQALALDRSNLQILCADCNLGKSNTDSIDWRAV